MVRRRDLVVHAEGGDEGLGDREAVEFAEGGLPQKGVELGVVVPAERDAHVVRGEAAEELHDGDGVRDDRETREGGPRQFVREMGDGGGGVQEEDVALFDIVQRRPGDAFLGRGVDGPALHVGAGCDTAAGVGSVVHEGDAAAHALEDLALHKFGHIAVDGRRGDVERLHQLREGAVFPRLDVVDELE